LPEKVSTKPGEVQITFAEWLRRQIDEYLEKKEPKEKATRKKTARKKS
jgi:hypothetical protein